MPFLSVNIIPFFAVLKKYPVAYMLAAIGFFLSFISLSSAYIYQLEYPFGDMTLIIQFLDGTVTGEIPNLLLGDGFKLNANEHMPILPLFIWKLDYILFDSRGRFPLLVSFGLVIFIAWLLAYVLTKESGHKSYFWMVFAVNLALLTSPVHYNNIAWEHQLLIYMSLALSLSALALASKSISDERENVINGSKIGLLATGATFSFGYGLLVWPALLWQIIFAKWHWKRAVPVLICLSISVFLYLSFNESSSNQLRGLMGFGLLLDLFTAMLELIALPITALFSYKFSQSYIEIAIGLLFLSIAVFFVFNLFRSGWQKARPPHQFAALIVFYCLGIFALTFYARVFIWDLSVKIPSRYVVISTIFLICLPIFCSNIFRFYQRPAGVRTHLTLCILICVMALIMYFRWLPVLKHQNMEKRIASLYTEFEVKRLDRFVRLSDLGGAFFGKNIQETWASYKKRNQGEDHVFIFEQYQNPAPSEWLATSTPVCTGRFESIETTSPPQPNLTAYYGWVLPSQKSDGKSVNAEWIVAVDVDTRKVVGIGAAGIDPRLLKLDVGKSIQGKNIGFIGFAKLASEKEVKFLLISNRSVVCNLKIDK